MQDHPGAPGTARKEHTRTIVLVNSGGVATQPRAPGHERPCAALRAARHGRLSAATRAPGADVPPATTAGAPGQYCLSAAPRAPGHGRPLATTAGTPCHDCLSAALQAPDAGARLAVTATPPSHHHPSALAIATAPLPACVSRLLQEVLLRVAATPHTLIHPQFRQNTAKNRTANSQTSTDRRSRSVTYPVHPALLVPTRPPPATAGTGFPRQRHSRAPPLAASLAGQDGKAAESPIRLPIVGPVYPVVNFGGRAAGVPPGESANQCSSRRACAPRQ